MELSYSSSSEECAGRTNASLMNTYLNINIVNAEKEEVGVKGACKAVRRKCQAKKAAVYTFTIMIGCY